MTNIFPTDAELAVMKELSGEDAGLNGLQIVDKSARAVKSGARSNATVKRGSVYVLLSRLEDKGLVSIKFESTNYPGKRRPIYLLTEAGKQVVLAAYCVETE